MTDAKATLDSLRIDRNRKAPSRGLGPWLIALAVVVVLAGAGAAAYVWWPRPGLAVHAATAEARGDIAAGGGLDATGYVVARHMATLSAKIMGRLVELNVEEGQRVQQGMVVARLDDSNYAAMLRQAQANVSMARVAYQDAAPQCVRYERLAREGAVSTDALERQRATCNAARENLAVMEAAAHLAAVNENDTIVRAPFSGIVTTKVAQVGEIVAPSTAGGGSTRTGIATIVDMDTLEVEVDVSENYIDRVHPGGAATIVLDAYSDWEIPASVIAVIPTADRSKGTVKVRVAIKAKDPRILPDMGARVTFATDANVPHAAPRGVLVPRDAVKDNGRSGTVFIIGNDDRLEKREVPLGTRTQQSVTVMSGVAPGERLVTGDQGPLQDGMKVTIEDAV